MGALTTPPPFLPATVNGCANSAFGLTGVERGSVGPTFAFGRWGASLPPSTFAFGHGVQLPFTTPSGIPRASYKSRSPRGSLASLSDATNWLRSTSDPPRFSGIKGPFLLSAGAVITPTSPPSSLSNRERALLACSGLQSWALLLGLLGGRRLDNQL